LLNGIGLSSSSSSKNDLSERQFGGATKKKKKRRFIHFMSLDVEGSELGILEGLFAHFDEFIVGAIALEVNHLKEFGKYARVRELLVSHGYSIDVGEEYMVVDEFWLHESVRHCPV